MRTGVEMALLDEAIDTTDRPLTAAEIHAELMAGIREGRFQPGQQLPNERQLAELYGSSRQQVRDALLILQDAGLVQRKVGSGDRKSVV